MPEEKEVDVGLDENSRAAFSYLLGWISGLFFFLTEEESDYVKFHAAQSITTFLTLHILLIILGSLFFTIRGFFNLTSIVSIIIIVLWIVLMIKSYEGKTIKLPITGEMAESLVKRF